MIFHDVQQGSDFWFDLRKGVPTASNFSKILTPKSGKLSAQADGYINELVGQTLSLIPQDGIENYTNRAMEWGRRAEEEARRYLSLHLNEDITNGGFCLTDDRRFGSSPDGLIGQDGVIEIKCPQPETQVAYLLKDDELPPEYRWQVQGHLLVTGRAYCLFVSYCPGLAPLVVRVEPSDDTKRLAEALEEFHAKYLKTLQRVREMA